MDDRVTYPVGTFLSNPSTAADGNLGGPAGNNPSTPSWLKPTTASQIPSYVGLSSPTVVSPARPSFANLPTYARNAMLATGAIAPVTTNTGQDVLFDSAGTPLSGKQYMSIRPNEAFDVMGNKYKLDSSTGTYIRESTTALKPNNLNSSTMNPSTDSDSLVGIDFGSTPNRVTFGFAKNILKGASNEEILQVMASKGYEYVPGAGGGQFFFTGGGTAPTSQQVQSTQGGYVDPTTLAKGERAKDNYGNTFVGGTPLPTGEAQYTQIYKMKKGQNFNSVVKKDKNGNWVRYVVPTYDRGDYRGTPAPAQTTTTQPTQEQQVFGTNQLVNLRVNYG